MYMPGVSEVLKTILKKWGGRGRPRRRKGKQSSRKPKMFGL